MLSTFLVRCLTNTWLLLTSSSLLYCWSAVSLSCGGPSATPGVSSCRGWNLRRKRSGRNHNLISIITIGLQPICFPWELHSNRWPLAKMHKIQTALCGKWLSSAGRGGLREAAWLAPLGTPWPPLACRPVQPFTWPRLSTAACHLSIVYRNMNGNILTWFLKSLTFFYTADRLHTSCLIVWHRKND